MVGCRTPDQKCRYESTSRCTRTRHSYVACHLWTSRRRGHTASVGGCRLGTGPSNVRREKRRKVQSYPLIASVGAAIARYLRENRPASKRRELFLGLNAPHGPISQGAVHYLVATGLKRVGARTTRFGPHSLRHACAGRLVTEGLSLKEIGDHLGHRGVSATRVYAKVNLTALREVAAFDLGGLR